MADSPEGRTLRVRFDELAFAEDLEHATDAGRGVARQTRARLERDGAALAELRPCDPEGRDGTRLPNCVKLYLPEPAGRWRMVLQLRRDPDGEGPQLFYRAFGLGHPTHAWQPSAYQVADRRLHPPE